MFDLKRKILSLAERQRLIETIALVSGVCGAFYGVILHKSIIGGILWATGNSIFGGLVAIVLVYFIGGTRIISHRRNKLEREVSMFLSLLGSFLIGSVLGGTMGFMMNLRHFSFIYGSVIDTAIVNIVDGTLMGGLGGIIGGGIGTLLAEINLLCLELYNRQRFKKKIRALRGEANVG